MLKTWNGKDKAKSIFFTCPHRHGGKVEVLVREQTLGNPSGGYYYNAYITCSKGMPITSDERASFEAKAEAKFRPPRQTKARKTKVRKRGRN